MSEFDFEPRIGRMRAAGSRRGRRYLQKVLAVAMRAGPPARSRGSRFRGGRIGRGAANARLLGLRPRGGRRVIIKARLVRLAGRPLSGARAHLRYIQRDGAGVDGARGVLYAAREDAADGDSFHERCSGDRHQFRFIVSPEDGAGYEDLRPLVRRLMARMEQDLDTRLDWVAADHRDTGHPHSHIIVRGRDERGANLVIARDYLSRGMRQRAEALVALDLGPVTDLEIQRRRQVDVGAERLTGTDRALLAAIGPDRTVSGSAPTIAEQAIRSGRLRKLEALGLAEAVGGGRWRLAEDLEAVLRRLGERGDIIRLMQRALTEARMDRPASEQRIFGGEGGATVIGQVVGRGLSDELNDRHYLIVDGTDGRVHYIDSGEGDSVEPVAGGAIVAVSALGAPALRESDQTVARVARATGGRYSADLHLQQDPSASPGFIRAHERRLEAMRRDLRLDRSEGGEWAIGPDHLEQVERWERGRQARQPVEVRMLSPLPLDRLAGHDGLTWLDRELAAEDPVPLRDAGFGREVRSALAARQQWLVRSNLAIDQGNGVTPGPDALETLRRRDLVRAARLFAAESGKEFVNATEGTRIDGVVRRRIDLAAGRFAVIEGSREFALVPWRPVLGRAMGKPVSGIMREAGTNWSIGRSRSLER